MYKNMENYNKHLSLEERELIENLLKKHYSIKDISKKIFRHPSTISKEIQKQKIRKEPTNFNNHINFCKKRKACHLINVCEKKCHSECRSCNICNKVCNEYEEELCINLNKSPYVCNGCESISSCRKIKYYYRSKEAHNQYLKTLQNSRIGINLSQEELEKLDNLISPLIKQGQSISQIYANHKKEIPCSIRCIYNYIEQNILSIKNIDLVRKVRYKKRKKHQPNKKDSNIKIGRTYEDFQNFISQNPNINVVEMDTVEGKKGGKVLLTLLFRNSNFMLAFLMPNKKSQSVVEIFDKLTQELGIETFRNIFGYILTDNGCEFSNSEALEKTSKGEARCKIYYCDAYSSYQKGKIEKNHEYIRYIIPKQTSMDNLTQEDISKMLSHINSVVRESLNYATPYDIAQVLLGSTTLEKLNIKKILPDDIILKPNLFSK